MSEHKNDDQLFAELRKIDTPDDHQRRRDLPEEPALPRPLQSLDRELVHRHLDPLHLP